MTDTAPQHPETEEPLAAGEDGLEAQPPARFGFEEGLRERTARGVLVNAAFQAGFAGLNVLQRFAVAAFLTTSEFGLWGLVLSTLLTLSFLKQIGIWTSTSSRTTPTRSSHFKRRSRSSCSTRCASARSSWCCCRSTRWPMTGPRCSLPSLILTLSLLGTALCAPLWIPFRRMEFVRQRVLEGVNPVVSTIVMVGLAIAGAGYWALVAGVLAGVYAAAIAAWVTCPYPIRLRFDRGTFREYVGFSVPVLLAGGAGLIVVQGTMFVANYTVGLAGVGAIALASSIIVFGQRVDAIVSRTIYPAICAVKDRTDLLHETFVKSNRVALMWGLPFGFGVLLFAPALVEFVLGSQWEPAVALLQVLGLIIGIGQLGFNWTLFFQATGETRPLAVSGLVSLGDLRGGDGAADDRLRPRRLHGRDGGLARGPARPARGVSVAQVRALRRPAPPGPRGGPERPAGAGRARRARARRRRAADARRRDRPVRPLRRDHDRVHRAGRAPAARRASGLRARRGRRGYGTSPSTYGTSSTFSCMIGPWPK